MPNPITDVLWWINSEVDKLSGVGLDRVKDILDAAQAELAQDLAKAKWLGTDEKYTAQVHRNALMQIQGAIDHLNKQVAPEMADNLRQSGHVAGLLATSHLTQEVEKFSSIFEGTVRPVAFEAASVIAQGDKTLWPRFRTSAARYAGQVGQDIRRQLAIGLVKGETIDQMTDRLARQGGPKGHVFTRGMAGDSNARAEYIAEGLFKRYRYWGERLARTETVNAYNEAALIGMDDLEESDPGYFKRWDAAVDGRLCPICKAMDDLVVPLDKKFPLGFDKPPRHPNCRCACVIWRKEWDEADTRDNILADVKPGKKPGSIESVPHKYTIPEKPRDDSALARRGKRVPGIPESAPASMTPAAPVKLKKQKLTPEQKIAKMAEKAAAFSAKQAKKAEQAKIAELVKLSKSAVKQMKADAKAEKSKEQSEVNVMKILIKLKTPIADIDIPTTTKAKNLYSKYAEKQNKKTILKENKSVLQEDIKTQATYILKDPGNSWKWDEDDFALVAENTGTTPAKLKAMIDKEIRSRKKAEKREALQARKLAREAKRAGARGAYVPKGDKLNADDFGQVPKGIFGKAFASDGDAVEGNSMHVRKTTEGYEVLFKVTAHHDPLAKLELDLDVKRDSFVMYKRQMVDGVMQTIKPDGFYKTEGQSVGGAYYQERDGYKFEIGKDGATRNQVRLTIKGGPKEAEKALQDFGERMQLDFMKRPTRADIELQAKARLSSKFDPSGYAEYVGATATPEKISDFYEKTARRFPIMRDAVDDVELREVYPGQIAPYSEKLAKYMGDYNSCLIHDGDPPKDVVKSILDESGLMASTTRYHAGIFTTGLSTGTDFKTGGADGVFTRLRKANQDKGYNSSGSYRFIVDKAQLGRLDFWAFNDDNYGRAGFEHYSERWTGEAIASTEKPDGGNEIIFQKGIPPQAIKHVVLSSTNKREFIEHYKSKGQTHINGVSLEEFFIEGGRDY